MAGVRRRPVGGRPACDRMIVAAHSMFARRRQALVTGLALLVVATVLTAIVVADRSDSALQAVDDWWLGWMVDVRTPWLTLVADVMAVLGGPRVMAPLRIAIIAGLAWQRRWLQLGAFFGAIVTSELCIGPLKAMIGRPRPPAPITPDSFSFPSGHAIAASVTAIGLVVVLVPAASRRTHWTIAAVTFTTLMAMSRTYLGVHWLSDVIAGVCIGTGFAVAWPAALELERARRNPSTPTANATRADRAAAWLRVVSLALVGIGLMCVVALHLLRPDLDPSSHRISEYAIGRYGPLMTVAFVSIGAGLLALGWPLAHAGGRWSRLVPTAIVAAGAGMVVAGIYRTDPDRSGVMIDAIHSRASALATVALIGAALAWSVVRSRKRDVTAGLAVVAAVLGALSPALHRSSWTGVSQRVLWLTLLAWLVVTAWRLRPPQGEGVGDRSEVAITTPW